MGGVAGTVFSGFFYSGLGGEIIRMFRSTFHGRNPDDVVGPSTFVHGFFRQCGVSIAWAVPSTAASGGEPSVRASQN